LSVATAGIGITDDLKVHIPSDSKSTAWAEALPIHMRERQILPCGAWHKRVAFLAQGLNEIPREKAERTISPTMVNLILLAVSFDTIIGDPGLFHRILWDTTFGGIYLMEKMSRGVDFRFQIANLKLNFRIQISVFKSIFRF